MKEREGSINDRKGIKEIVQERLKERREDKESEGEGKDREQDRHLLDVGVVNLGLDLRQELVHLRH